MKNVQTLPGVDIQSDRKVLVAKIGTRLKKIVKLQKRKPVCDLEKLHSEGQNVQDALQDKFCAFECESGDVEMQWNNIKKGSVNTTSDLLVKVDWGARKPWITQEVISKMDEERKWMSTTKKKEKKTERR